MNHAPVTHSLPVRVDVPASGAAREPVIHPTAIIDPSAQIAPGVEIGPYCVVGPRVVLGEGTILHDRVTVHGPTVMGRGNVVYSGAVLGGEPQDLKYRGAETSLVIGDRNRFREHVTVHRGTEMGGGKTIIGNDCLFMVATHIAHDCVIEDQVVLANGTMLGGHCLVEFGAGIGGSVGVHHFTTIGTLSFVGGMSRITKDVPPYLVVEGSPAEVRKVNTTALIRRRWAPEEIEQVREAHRLLYRNDDVPMSHAFEMLRADPMVHPAVLRLCNFLERAEAGTHGRYRESLRNT